MARRLGNWISSYMEYTRYSEAPASYHFWTAVATIAAVLRRKVYFDQKQYYQWSPNFYIIFVAPPGIATKSTSLNMGMSLLADLGTIRLGPNTMTWQYLPTALAEAHIEWPLPAKSNMEQEYFPMCCLTFASSELGALIDPRDRGMIDMLVDLWDGKQGVWEKATKFAGSDKVINPWINMIACTTPAWLMDNLPRTMVGGGFVSRCVFVFANAKRQLVAYPGDQMNGVDLRIREDLLHDLEEMSMLAGPYSLTEEARLWGKKWYDEHWDRFAELDTNSSEGFAARMQCHIHKLAMVLSASRSDDMLIQQHDLQAAAKIVRELEAGLSTIFRAVDTVSEQAHLERMLSFVRKNKHISKGLLYRQFMHMMTHDKFESAIVAAHRAGFVEIKQTGVNVIISYKEPTIDATTTQH